MRPAPDSEDDYQVTLSRPKSWPRRQRPGLPVKQQPVMAGEPATQAVINAGIPNRRAPQFETPARPWLRYPSRAKLPSPGVKRKSFLPP